MLKLEYYDKTCSAAFQEVFYFLLYVVMLDGTGSHIMNDM
ncbi:2246_t:CDS:2 [Ambispora leptoticha]|uniref:2246_t:CDS:1 n=1 Tax=Ambispora leptoticha TaxID=144679 RepID=A0A9N8WPP2_9GLOM|nr:2246_t:CDS:2 [Ambispora leptoticha]